MAAPKNGLKARLAQGEIAQGCWLNIGSATAAEIAAGAGFDWLLIDAEHTPNDLGAVLEQLRALGPHPCAVRLADGDPSVIKRVLDMGVQTLLIPMVESAAEAAALVRATRYPPLGMRGLASAHVRASRYGADAAYQATADAEICLIVQVETRKGLAALDDILAVEGLDGVFIGPSDLAADLGHGSPDAPEARATVEDALRRIAASSKWAGTFAATPESRARALAAGAIFLGVAADVILLAKALRGAARA